MRYTAIRRVLPAALPVLLLGASVSTGCAMPAGRIAPVSPATLHDPLIGLAFDSSARGFDVAPADLAGRCPDLANERYTQRLWVFADAERDGARYLMVAGRFMPRRAGDQPVDNAVGTLLRLDAGGCTLLGPATELFLMPDAYADSVPAPARTALAADAARRFVAGHGGAAGLATAMRRAGKTLATLPPALRPAFAAIPGLPR